MIFQLLFSNKFNLVTRCLLFSLLLTLASFNIHANQRQALSPNQIAEQLRGIEQDMDAFIVELYIDSSNIYYIYCARSSLSSIRDLLGDIGRFYSNNVYQEDIDAYRANLDRVKSDWYNCLEQTSSNPLVLDPIEHRAYTALEQMRSLLPLIENPNDRAFSEEFIDFGQGVILSENTQCQEQMDSDPDFSALNQMAVTGMCSRRMAECQSQFSLVKEKWDQCINN